MPFSVNPNHSFVQAGIFFFVGEFFVELIAETIGAFADYQTAIIGSVRKEVHEGAELVRL